MNTNIILCGVGGQGTVLASKLISAAAMIQGLPIRTAETIGMAQRGGSVFSHLRIGEGTFSPLIAHGEADLIIGFEPGEALRQLPYLKKDGTVVVSRMPVLPVSSMIGQSVYEPEKVLEHLRKNTAHLVEVDAERALKELGSPKVLNVVLLGAAERSGALGLSGEALRQAVRENVPPRFLALNEAALSFTGA